MLTLYRRHLPTCPHKEKGRGYQKCLCPLWVDNGESGKSRIRHSLKTNVWTRGCEMVRDMVAGVDSAHVGPVSVRDACDRYVADCEGRRLALATCRKTQSVLLGSSIERMEHLRKAPALVEWAKENGVRVMSDWNLDRLERYRRSWNDAQISGLKRLELLTGFFAWAKDHGMVRENFAAKLRRPILKPIPKMPYTEEEFQRLLFVLGVAPAGESREDADDRGTLRALIKLIRYSGLRISDALKFSDSSIEHDRIRLYQHKTGAFVSIPMPGWLVSELMEAPKAGPNRWFLRPGQTAINSHEYWRRKLADIAAAAGVSKPGFHRFRHTFACELLGAGVSIDHVSILLGHSSVKMTERHYAPWIVKRQEQMDRAVLDVWGQRPQGVAAASTSVGEA